MENDAKNIHSNRVPAIADAVAGRRAIRRPLGLWRGITSDGKGDGGLPVLQAKDSRNVIVPCLPLWGETVQWTVSGAFE